MKTTKELLDFYDIEEGKMYKVISAKSIQNGYLVGNKFLVDLVNDSIVLKFTGSACMYTLLNELCYQEVKHEPLTDEEKDYLRVVIEPLRNEIKSVYKSEISTYFEGGEVLYINLISGDYFRLPERPHGEMFAGIEKEKRYTLEELGI